MAFEVELHARTRKGVDRAVLKLVQTMACALRAMVPKVYRDFIIDDAVVIERGFEGFHCDRSGDLTVVARPADPVYGLWIPAEDRGAGEGTWLLDTSAVDCDRHPAVFFTRAHAEMAAEAERRDFPGIRVVELRAVGVGALGAGVGAGRRTA
jgi:hypothetical protein